MLVDRSAADTFCDVKPFGRVFKKIGVRWCAFLEKAAMPPLSFKLARPRSLRFRLILLVVSASVPLLVFAAAMVVLSARNERAVFERGATERTRALITAVDAELKSSINTLEGLATSRLFDRGDLRGFYDEAARVVKSQPGWRTVIVSLPSGESLVNLLRPLGAELAPVVEQRSFNQVLNTLKPAVGDVLFGPLTRTYDFIIRVPVMRDGKIKYVLSAVISAGSINALLSPQKLPANWIGVVLSTTTSGLFPRTIEPERNLAGWHCEACVPLWSARPSLFTAPPSKADAKPLII